MNQTKKELSYFRLKLEGYLRGHHPELVTNSAFIGARTDLARSTYCDSVALDSRRAKWIASPSLRRDFLWCDSLRALEVCKRAICMERCTKNYHLFPHPIRGALR